MKTFASLTVAAFVLAAAGSASAHEARTGWSDLDLSTAAGAEALDVRIDAVAARLCRDARRPGSRLSDRTFCRVAVRADVMRQLPEAAKADYVLGRRSFDV